MTELVLRLPWDQLAGTGSDALLDREWLVTNGLGGYASGTVAGPCTRRYHGLLIAALPSPFGRRMMLNHLIEQLRFPDRSLVHFGGEEKAGGRLEAHGIQYLKEFRLEAGLPIWTYHVKGAVFERRLWMSRMQNTVYIRYRLLQGGGPVRLKLQPSIHFRSHDAQVSEIHADPYIFTAIQDRYELADRSDLPPLRFYLYGQRAAFTVEGKKTPDLLYRVEESRGYAAVGDLWSPGHFRADLGEGQEVTLIASTDQWQSALAMKPETALRVELERRSRLNHVANPAARTGWAANLVLAADQFIISPVGRVEDSARVRAYGDELRSVIAGYHWFTDWGRDTMISLEGLTLTTGRQSEAGYILRTFSYYIRDGLIPNLFPEGENQGLYHTADATLWYFHAIHRYLQMTGDRQTLRVLLPKLRDIVAHHLKGTRFGIHVDPSDGLLHQGEEGYQLTWMDAKVGDWVVTPRRGKAVEINALWYNALRLLEGWIREEQGETEAHSLADHAERARTSFNRRFWYDNGGYLYDVVDGEHGDDPSCRPNQVFAIALDYPVLDPARWQPVMATVQERLLTPVGLRTLAPGSPDFKAKYFGDLRARDAAYHQGTVWPWLIGPFVDAWLKLHPEDRTGARRFLEGFKDQLTAACIGTISEVYDAEPPYIPRGCVAQGWSVAEVLRSLVKTAD